MLSRVDESRMRLVRGGLAIGWLILIVSLFYDPVTPWLTRPDNSWSPFRLKPREVFVQGVALKEEAYAMGPRIFWTMVLPCVPLFLMVFGHEAWRRICPLSFFSQIPRMLGRQAVLRSFSRTSGLVEEKLRLLRPDSWLRKNFWYVQFGLLWLGVSARIVAINSDGRALGTFFILVIGSAVTVGYFFGGKTWCNYICPVSVVQRIYTEPHGILESQAHLQKQPVTQSMCRSSTPNGDQSTCVGCLSPCPDIDLERAYWQTLETPGRRFSYYGYFGLVLGFYGYYYLYAGNWSYYYSGIWTHEIGALSPSKIFGPGFYFGGVPIPVPKIIAAPLSIAAFILAAFSMGCLAEKIYAWSQSKLKRSLDRRLLLHRCFSVTTFLTINAFYLFGGRPNIGMLPESGQTAVTAVIVTMSTLWLVRALGRSPVRYQRESVVNTLLKQLKKFSADFSRFLEGRSLDDLGPDEVYLLAKTVPGFSQDQKQQVYKNVLRESLATGQTNSSHSLTMLAELRLQVGVSDDLHHSILKELGIEDPNLLDPNARKEQEDQLRLENYRSAMVALIARAAEQGVTRDGFGESAAFSAELRSLQSVYQITAEEQTRIREDLDRDHSGLVDHAAPVLREVGRLTSVLYTLRHRVDDPANPLCRMLQRGVLEQRERHAGTLLRIAASARNESILFHFADQLFGLLGEDVNNLTRVQREATSPPARSTQKAAASKKQGSTEPASKRKTNLATCSLREAIRASTEPETVFGTLARDLDPIMSGLALLALAESNAPLARRLLEEILKQFDEAPWFLREVSAVLFSTPVRASSFAPVARDEVYDVVPATTITKLSRLTEVGLFEKMPLGALAELARHGELRRYVRSSIVCKEGEPSDFMFLVFAGAADVFHQSHDGTTPVSRVVEGQAVGEMGVFTKKPRAATVVIASDVADLLAFGEEHLDQVWDNPHASRGILLRVFDYYQMARGHDDTTTFAHEVAEARPLVETH
jgi:hypothetical protein